MAPKGKRGREVVSLPLFIYLLVCYQAQGFSGTDPPWEAD